MYCYNGAMKPEDLQQRFQKLVHKQFDVSIDAQVTEADPQYGDYSTNVAFQLAGKLKQSPAEIAQQLADAINDPMIAGAAAVNGYLNITLHDSYWLKQLTSIDHSYGKSDKGKGTKVQVEFISANPTGPTTIGNARGGFIGDVIARVYDRLGYDVTREYYFNNAGTQIGKLVESVKVSAGVIKVPDEDVQYRGDYIQDLAKEFKTELATKDDKELAELLTTTILDRYVKPAVAKMGIEFDVWFNEIDLIKGGQLEDVIKRLSEKGLVFERDGATWLDTKKLGLGREERVLIKSNGDPTYLAPDIAYHDDLFNRRGFDKSITELGADHIDQFPSVKAATLALNPGKEMDIAPHQWFHLIKDGKEVKMSKRLGQYVTVEALIDEVGAPVARFITLTRSNDSQMDFDLDLAKEQSQKNPYHYVMYAYVRAQSILAKAAEQQIKHEAMQELVGVEKQLVQQMATFPVLLEQIAADYSVHRLTFYGMELAKLFHEYYETVPILSAKGVRPGQRLSFVHHFAEFMTSYFDVLGIKPVSKM